MKHDVYLITGATGATGGAAIEELLSSGASVRALVHRDDERAASLRTSDVEVVVGDLLDSHAVQAALRDVTGAYFVYPIMQPQLVDATAYFAHAAKLAGVRSIVNMSQIFPRAPTQGAMHRLRTGMASEYSIGPVFPLLICGRHSLWNG